MKAHGKRFGFAVLSFVLYLVANKALRKGGDDYDDDGSNVDLDDRWHFSDHPSDSFDREAGEKVSELLPTATLLRFPG